MTNSPYKLVILDKQGKIDFVGHYPTYEQAYKAAEFLKECLRADYLSPAQILWSETIVTNCISPFLSRIDL